jgi:hypothetical protein
MAIPLRAACAALALAALIPAANAQSTSEDKLALMVSGATLTHTDGGWGGAAMWLHYFNANTVAGLGGEHQSLGDARWNFGKLNLSHGFGEASARTNLYLEGNEGTGKDATHDYDYSIWAVGLYQNLTRQLILQLEDRQVDVDTARGNLPKAAVQYLWTPQLATTVGYAHSFNDTVEMRTRLWSGRIDGYTKSLNLFVGLANGQAAAILINPNLPNESDRPSILHEYYAGVTRSFSRADTTLALDFSRLNGNDHWTLTFNATLHRRTGAAR